MKSKLHLRKKLAIWSERQSKLVIVILASVMLFVLGELDLVTGSFSFLIFYLIPVFYVTWFADRIWGILISVASGLVWFIDDLATSSSPQRTLMPFWSLFASVIFMIFVSYLVHRLKTTISRERELASTDYLTGLNNSRVFNEVVQQEIDRCRRYKHLMSLAYIDLDNFKEINDHFGHSAGDSLLTSVADSIKKNLRTIDIAARLGGDEFAILLPETDSVGAKIVISRVKDQIDALFERERLLCGVSVGIVTCNTPCESFDAVVRLADEAMYAAKKAGKNRIDSRVY
jgi:diguanylate cyclase (GGDEF)-like protein